MENYIGVFDSGIGGVTVLKEMLKLLPNENFYYYSDSLNNPYGDKSKEELEKIVFDIVDKLLKKNCKMIVIACNTASAICRESLRAKYRDIPIVAIEPAYKMVYDYGFFDKTLVLATKGTIESENFNMLYQKYNNNKTELISCSGLADLIEQDDKEKIRIYLKENLSKYKGYKNIVLGCTHYPLIKDEIKKVLGNVTFFDGSIGVSKEVKRRLEGENLINNNTTNSSKIEFFDSTNSKLKRTRFFTILTEKNKKVDTIE